MEMSSPFQRRWNSGSGSLCVMPKVSPRKWQPWNFNPCGSSPSGRHVLVPRQGGGIEPSRWWTSICLRITRSLRGLLATTGGVLQVIFMLHKKRICRIYKILCDLWDLLNIWGSRQGSWIPLFSLVWSWQLALYQRLFCTQLWALGLWSSWPGADDPAAALRLPAQRWPHWSLNQKHRHFLSLSCPSFPVFDHHTLFFVPQTSLEFSPFLPTIANSHIISCLDHHLCLLPT